MKTTKHMTYDKLLNFIKQSEMNEQVYYVYVDGTIHPKVLMQYLFAKMILNIPVTKFALEQLQYAPKINISREPKIPLRLNPGITKKDIQETKHMVQAQRR